MPGILLAYVTPHAVRRFTESRMRIVLNIVAVLGLFVGSVWFLQGINVLPGSFMTGQIEWAVYGGSLACGAVALLIYNNRRKPSNGNPT